MDLLCGIPKPSRPPPKPQTWGSWGRTVFSSVPSPCDHSYMKSTLTTRLGGGGRCERGNHDCLLRCSTSLLHRHLLYSNYETKKAKMTKSNPYSTLFSIPEGGDHSLSSEKDSSCREDNVLPPLKRSRTLPTSAIRRSNCGSSPIFPMKDTKGSRDDLSIETLKGKFKVECLRRHFKSKIVSKKDENPPSLENRDKINIKSETLRAAKKDSIRIVRKNSTLPAGGCHNLTSEYLANCQPPPERQGNSKCFEKNSLKEKETMSISTYEKLPTYVRNGDESASQRNNSKDVVDVSSYRTSAENIVCVDSGKEEAKQMQIHSSSNSVANGPTSTNSMTSTEGKDFSSSHSFPHSMVEATTPVPENEQAEQALPSPLFYSDSLSEKCQSVADDEESSLDRAERHSSVSSASDGSRLTFGTSTDEGISSIYSETSGSLWWSSVSSAASIYSPKVADEKSATFSSNGEGMSERGSTSPGYASSIAGSSVSTSRGAVPKTRASSFRRCRGREAQAGLASEPWLCCDDISKKDMCGRCKKESESNFKRGGSLRAPKQLPVTPTLLRLLQLGLEQVGGVGSNVSPNVGGSNDVTNGVVGVRREKLHPPRTDPHRLSRANLEESGEVELDAILNELCALETKFNFEISSSSKATSSIPNPSIASTASSFNHFPAGATMPSGAIINSVSSADIQTRKWPPIENFARIPRTTSKNPAKMQQHQTPHHTQLNRPKTHARNGSGGGFKAKYESLNMEMDVSPSSIVTRTDSPDNDSAFSDNVSMLSSESSASSGASGGGGVTSKQDASKQLSGTEQAAKVKAEKIKMALEKLKEANVKKLFIKAFSNDGSSKSLLVDEKMSVAQVCRMLTDKNHVRVDPKWAVVEHLPDLYMERIYEDDEMLVDNLLMWTRDSKNKLLFVERPDKYDLFFHPETYLLYGNTHHNSSDIDDEARNNLLEEFFSSSRVPEVEGPLFLKSEGKKAWKKFYFVLRQSGLYYCPKGKSSRSSKDLICLATLENNQVYDGFGWKKKFKAPTDWGFALKPPHLQAKSSKHIKYLCAEDESNLRQWVMGIRIAKSGQRMQDNYRVLVEDIAQEDIDLLASSRSFSLASVTASSRGPSEATTPSSESRSLDSCLAPSLQEEDAEDASSSAGSSSQDTPVNTLCRAPAWRHDSLRSGSSSSSSGCLSERSSSTGTPPIEGGFEADFPQQGTIKRKPSSNPKLPLTSTTRHLVKEVDPLDEDGGSQRTGSLRHGARRSLSEEVSSLRRRNSSSTQGRTSVASTASSALPANPSIEEDDIDSLPLPPPPVELGTCDPELLPPPPPELLASTLSLNSLPPPPDEATMPAFSGEDIMTASITSLPPPPPPPPNPFTVPHYGPTPPATPPKPKVCFSPPPLSPPAVAPKPRRDSADTLCAVRVPMSPTTDHQHPLVSSNGWQPHSPSPPPPPIYAQPQKSPQKKVKKITFLEDVQSFPPSPCPSPPCPQSPSSRPPQPPKRSLSTKLSQNPGRLDAPGCKVTPPKSFLNNLQRVMQKKWQVAQKCRDFDKMPHEVLGFRDPLPQVETEKNVGAWIQEHYGRLYENLAPQTDVSTGGMPPTNGALVIESHNSSPHRPESLSSRISKTVPGAISKKKPPPPPPPKRSDTTQLSMRH